MGKFKVLVSGCNGQMGHIVCKLIEESNDMEVVAGFDTAMREFSKFTVFEKFSDLEETYAEDENIRPNVIIDFSSPQCTMKLLKYAVDNNINMVIGTTGFTDEQIAEIKKCSSSIKIFISDNMSYQLNLIVKILKEISPKLVDNNDIEIAEIHHNRKKLPSRTTQMLAQSINSSLENQKKIVFDHSGKRENDEIGITSLTSYNVVGIHSIYYLGQYETLEITHTALSRELFAEGALRAARFLFNHSGTYGLYSMDDLM